MRKDFIVERQGKSFVLYAGLLDMAHQQGLKSIHTELLQVPSEDNARVAITLATVILERDGKEYRFTGIGDAAPQNVAPAMQHCLIRMSETRAKARALRDAVNVGVAAFEELGEEGAHDGAPEQGYALGVARRPSRIPMPPNMQRRTESNGHSASNGVITESQLKAIRSICQRYQLNEVEILQKHFVQDRLEDLTQAQASELITTLNTRHR